MSTLFLIRGLPGSGKSTLAQYLFFYLPDTYHLEADMYFMKDGEYHFDRSKIAWAHKWCREETSRLLAKGYNVIVSNTSTTEKEVQVYQDIAKRFDAKFSSIIVENRHEGENVHDVPKETLQKMKDRFSVKL